MSNKSAHEMSIQIKKTSGTVKDVLSLVRYMVDKMGYATAKLKLKATYGVEITIDWRDLK